MKKKWLLIPIIIIFIIGLTNIQKKEDTIDDYYNKINQKTLEKITLKEDEYSYSLFVKYQEDVEEEIKEISKEMLQSDEEMNRWTQLFLDENKRNQTSIEPLQEYLTKMDQSNTIEEFIQNVYKIEKDLSIGILSNITIQSDLKDNSKSIVYLEPIVLDFGLLPYMIVEENYSTYKAYIKQYQIKLMKLYGYNTKKAREISSNIIRIQEEVAKKSKSSEELSDIPSLYNRITKQELQELYSNLNIEEYLTIKKIENEPYYCIEDMENYKAWNSILTNENLDTLKEYVKLRIVESYANFASIEYDKTISELNNKLIGIQKEYNLEEITQDAISSLYEEKISNEYIKRNIKEEDRELIQNMIEEIIEYYKIEIKDIDWLQEDTKEKALLKLEKMTSHIAEEQEEGYFYKIDETKSLIENIILLNQENYNHYIESLKENNKKTEISQTVVNAYYNPQDNSINFPAAFYKFINQENTYYQNLGSVGMVIAHEITHAFDSNGALFDEKGNLNNWWNKADYQKFEKQTKRVEEYYSQYEVNGIKVDGKKTLGENIADLGAVKAISTIAEEKGANKKELKTLFKSFASMWQSKNSDSYQKLLLSIDTHSPEKVRVNATLSSCNIFYDTYHISAKDKMFIEKEKRVSVW